MEKIKLILDTISNIDPKLAEEKNIGVFPFKLILDDKVYTDMVDISSGDFFKELEKAEQFHTSIPSPQEFMDFVKAFIDQGYNKFIVYPASSGLTGMSQMMQLVAEELKEDYGVEIDVIDTKSAHFPIVFAGLEIQDMIDSGKSFEEVKTKAHENLSKMEIHGTIRSFDYLIKGGRAPKALKFINGLIYPTFYMGDGLIKLMKKDVGKARNVKSFVDITKEEVNKHKRYCLGMTYGTNLEDFEKVKEKLKDEIENAEIYIEGQLTSSLALHLGPDNLVCAIYSLD